MHETAEQLDQKHIGEPINYYERHKNDTETWLAETLNGSMRTRFEYQLYGNELHGEDGGELGEIFDDAIEAAHIIAEENPNLLFELRRRLIEKDEYDDMLAMARGDLVDEDGIQINTMVVVSDFPPELMDAGEDVGGYNAGRKQTMLRVITKQSDGSISMVTQSLDRSNRVALEALYGALGAEQQEGELLEQRVYRNLPEQWQGKLVDNLTDVYDESLAEQHGGSWHAGIKLPYANQNENTYDFARAQTDLIEWFVDEKLKDPIGAEKLRFELAATIAQRYENEHSSPDINKLNHNNPTNARHLLMAEIEQATNMAIAENRVFNGCGSTVSSAGQLNEAGFGNKVDEESDYKFDKKMHCVVCQKTPKKQESKKMCGPCGICSTCDIKLSTKS